ncbi:MAG: hypothetical protein MK364_09500, partial [Pirellulales bacterium]|nr:hypothetical protein [Pirellulales bacterium]
LGGLIAAMKDGSLCWCSGWIANPAVESSRGLQSLVDGRMRFIVAENSCLMQRLFTMLTMKFAVLARNQILAASLRNDLRTTTSFLISDQIEVFDLFAGQGCPDDARDTFWMCCWSPYTA